MNKKVMMTLLGLDTNREAYLHQHHDFSYKTLNFTLDTFDVSSINS